MRMTTTTTLISRSAWYDRWTKPTLSMLVEPLKAHHRRQFVHIIEKLDALEHVEKTILWYGPSWRWTIGYSFIPPAVTRSSRNGNGKTVPPPTEPEIVCYLVPNVDNPLVCVPLRADEATALCAVTGKNALGRYVKEGVATAKCAVQTRWATWGPATENETMQILDLLRRKYELLRNSHPTGNPQDN